MDGTQSLSTRSEPGHPRERAAAQTMSMRYWGLDWSKHLPWQVGDITIDIGSCDDALPFIAEHYGSIFGTAGDTRFVVEEMTAARTTFYRECDVFVFRSDNQIVGIHICHPSDWSSYYLRTLALLPAYRGSKFYVRFNERLSEVLASHGVARIDVDVAPANFASMTMCCQRGYLPTATLTSDRWGTMFRFTGFLSTESETKFRAQLVSGAWPTRRID
jgi:hypothetical protein